ncbi:hypothetical protein GCM10011354_00780 [Egicoccus halophilus]|uniref:Uncharacterized protein n=1 Tax=Egicoccus halophilus TaxID=1670830 RepID=A0A8J3ESA6_9ACTN|nr:hypothetical protein GCM10011354_00780 [Egicoccus halophilus]
MNGTRTAHLLCDDGITAELWLGALVAAGADVAGLQAVVDKAGIGARVVVERITAREVAAVEVFVDDAGHDPDDRLPTASAMHEAIEAAGLAERPAARAHDLADVLIRAEAAVHDLPAGEVHLHELGRPRTVARILAGVVALEQLGIGTVTAGAVALGGGTIDIAHGRFPVPPPVVLQLLRGFVVRGDEREVELTTPSGAAVLTALASPSPTIPPMRLETSGRGALCSTTAGGRTAAGHQGDRLLTVLIGTSV